MTSELKALPMEQAEALVLSFVRAYIDGKVNLNALHKLTHETLHDGRLGLITALLNAQPIPEYETHQAPEIDMMQARLDAVRASLPGIYKPVHAAGYRMQQTIKEVEEQKEAESPLVDYRKELTDTLDKYPIWRAFLIHPEPTIRLNALARVGTIDNPIKEAAIVFGLGDSNATVRMRARALLGAAPAIKHRATHYSKRDVANRGTIAQAISQIMDISTDDELRGFCDDPRTAVRYAAARRLPSNSSLWGMMASDTAPRVRRVIAERVPLALKDVVNTLLQDPNQAIRTAIGRRTLEQDIVIPTNTPAQRRTLWADRLGE